MRHVDATPALDGTTWAEHRSLVLTKIAENSETIDKLREAIQQMAVAHSTEIAVLKVKSGVWGFAGGIFSAVGIVIIAWLKK